MYSKHTIKQAEMRNFQTICSEVQHRQVVNLTHTNNISFLYRLANDGLDRGPKATSMYKSWVTAD
jgi:hypothetical protein